MNKILTLFFSISLCSYLLANDINDVYKRCVACHGAKGELPALGRNIIISKLSKDEFIKSLKEYKNGNKNISGLGGIMQAQAYTLNEKDFEKLAQMFNLLNKKEKR